MVRGVLRRGSIFRQISSVMQATTTICPAFSEGPMVRVAGEKEYLPGLLVGLALKVVIDPHSPVLLAWLWVGRGS